MTTENAALLTNAVTRSFVVGSVVRGGVHVASTGLLTLAVGLVNHVVGISKGGVLGAVLGAFIVAVIGKEGRVAIKLLCLFGSSWAFVSPS